MYTQFQKNPSDNIFDKDQLKRSMLYNQDNFQRHFNERIQTRNEFYDKYNDVLQQKWETLMEDKGLDIYQRGLINEQTIPNNLIVQPNQISPLLNSVEQENSILRIEVKHLAQDLQRFIAMVELLLEENRYVRDKLSIQNNDLNKLVEVIGINEKEDFNDQRQKIEILQEENQLLINQLENLKQFKDDYRLLEDKSELELARAKEVFERCSLDKELALKREEQLSKQVLLIEPKFTEALEQIAQLEFELKNTQDDFKNKEFEFKEIGIKFNQLKIKYEDYLNNSQAEIDQLTVELESQTDERLAVQNKIQPLQQIFTDQKQYIQKLQHDNDQLQIKLNKFILEQEKSKGLVQNEKIKSDQQVQNFKNLQENIVQLKQKLQVQENLKKHQEDQMNKYLDDKQKEIQKLKQQHDKERYTLLQQLNSDGKDREIDILNLQRKVDAKDSEANQLSRQLQLKENDIKAYKQKIQTLQDLQNQLDSANSTITQKDNVISQLQQNLLLEKQEKQTDLNYQEQFEELQERYNDQETQYKELEQQYFAAHENQEIEELKQSILELNLKIQQINQEKEEYYNLYRELQQEYYEHFCLNEENKIQSYGIKDNTTTGFKEETYKNKKPWE